MHLTKFKQLGDHISPAIHANRFHQKFPLTFRSRDLEWIIVPRFNDAIPQVDNMVEQLSWCKTRKSPIVGKT